VTHNQSDATSALEGTQQSETFAVLAQVANAVVSIGWLVIHDRSPDQLDRGWEIKGALLCMEDLCLTLWAG